MPLFTSEYVFSDDYPTIEPSLKLDFANARALDPRITFTRASTATYVGANGLVKTAGDDEPRFDHDPTTGESLGLLIEESRTNLYPISETYTSWNVDNNATKTTDGTTIAGLTAIKLTSNVDTNALFLEGNNATFASNTTYTASVYHKVGNVDGFWFEARNFSDGGTPKIYFNSSTETWSATSGGTAPEIWSVKSQKVESNAWRHSITFYIGTDTAGSLRIGALAPANSTNVSAGDYGYLAAPQIEVGAFATSYIPTNGSTVTRAEDEAVIKGNNFSDIYNETEGSLFAEFNTKVNTGSISKWAVSLRDPADNNNYIAINTYGANLNALQVKSGGSVAADLSVASSVVVDEFRKIASSFKLNDFDAADGGTLLTGDTSGAMPTGITQMDIGRGWTGSVQKLEGHIKVLKYYNKRLPNAQLQGLTQQ
jgi:hypothetical protein